jgi:DNA-binding transcriptional LysR family regulator
MDLRQLNALVAIADYGSFSAAAEALATVQSNVSTHVKKLEAELNVELVDRATGSLTEAGHLVVDRTRRVTVELDALAADVTALTHEVVGVVRLGIIGTAARWLVPQLIEITPERYPHLHLVFLEATTIGLDTQLANGHVDLGVLGLPASGSELRTEPLFEEDLVMAVPMDHPVAKQEMIHLAQLADFPLILPLRGVSYRDELDAVTAAHRITLHPRAEVDSLRLMTSLSFEGAGYGILPSGAASKWRTREWTLIPVEGLAPRLVGVAQRRRGLPGAPVRALLELLRSIVADETRTPQGVRPVLAPPSHAETATPTISTPTR